MREISKRTFPGLIPWHRRLRELARRLRHGHGYVQDVFDAIHRENAWGNAESVSGPGSTLDGTRNVQRALPGLIEELGVRTMLDIPCGDFNWMRRIDLRQVHYIGADIVPKIIERNTSEFGGPRREFIVRDVTRDPLPNVDLVLCRDCLIHLSLGLAEKALKNVKRSGSRYLLTTTYTRVRENREIVTGDWRPLNLERAPFLLPAPLRTIPEDEARTNNAATGRALGLWRIVEL